MRNYHSRVFHDLFKLRLCIPCLKKSKVPNTDLVVYVGRANESGFRNLDDETTNDIQSEEELEEIIYSMHDGDAAPEDQSVGDLAENDPPRDKQTAND